MGNSKNRIDSDLVVEYQSGNKKALITLVKRWHKQFCKLAFWYVKDKSIAKDIAQESWIVIFNKLGELQDPKKFKSWAISIVNRKAIDFLRVQARERRKIEKVYNDSSKSISYEPPTDSKSQIIIKLRHEIENLSANQKAVIKLFYLEEYSLKEISELLGISIGTIKSRLFHAREKLKLKYRNYEK